MHAPEEVEQAMEQGAVKWFNAAKGYGFITRDEGGDLFFHAMDVAREYRAPRGEAPFEDGQRVEFAVVSGPKGDHAQDVQPGV